MLTLGCICKHFSLLFDLLAQEELTWNAVAGTEFRICAQSLVSVIAIFCTMAVRFPDSRSSLALSEFSDEI